ncbi:hypothetical protein M1105_13345 [Limibaculum sp. FT325]|uniref:hypothetical protein n=1 Tax=Thermohalobaculum sediminis TaxID=2939436 RepID=UPI0020BF4CE0|nr:hypothetical protein [Limibaculum sediminis]MCL5777968.1 hypothetical protein [Limibaculum sediminis]
MSIFFGRGSPSSTRMERQTLSSIEQAAVMASSGSISAALCARSTSRKTVSKFTFCAALESFSAPIRGDVVGIDSKNSESFFV